MVFDSVSRLSMSLTFQPVMPLAALNAVAASPAMHTPATVPPVATTVFMVGPPIRYMVTMVVTVHTNTDTQNGECP